MSNHDARIKDLDKKITELSDALAHLGKGTTFQELLKIIRFPGYTTPAELAFNFAIVDSMQAHVTALAKLSQDFVSAAKLVGQKEKQNLA